VKKVLVSFFVSMFVLVVTGCGTNVTRTSNDLADREVGKVLLESQNQVSKNETSNFKSLGRLYIDNTAFTKLAKMKVVRRFGNTQNVRRNWLKRNFGVGGSYYE
jgi:hypothetical protein